MCDIAIFFIINDMHVDENFRSDIMGNLKNNFVSLLGLTCWYVIGYIEEHSPKCFGNHWFKKINSL